MHKLINYQIKINFYIKSLQCRMYQFFVQNQTIVLSDCAFPIRRFVLAESKRRSEEVHPIERFCNPGVVMSFVVRVAPTVKCFRQKSFRKNHTINYLQL
jgi:hypothetical protein